MQIAECHFDLPLFLITAGNNHLCLDGAKGKYLCLFSEELFAERFKAAGQVIRVIEGWEPLRKLIEMLESAHYAGVCFDLAQTADGPRSKFAFDWDIFKEAAEQAEA